MLIYKRVHNIFLIKRILIILNVIGMISLGVLFGCGDKAFLEDAITAQRIFIESGDIIILSGGSVARTATPFPLHQIHVFSSNGAYKGILHNANSSSFLMGMDFSFDLTKLLFTVDGTDRVDSIDLEEQTTPSNHLIDGTNLTGATLRTMAVLSDGGTVVAESTTSYEKYDSSGTRITTNFPITVTANTMKVRAISGGRFALVFTGGTDSVSIRTNAGVVSTSISSGLACATNCDPSDILELPDGRFVVAYQNATNQSLQIYDSSFTRIGALFADTTVLQSISALALHSSGDILACSTSFNTCERLAISGNTATRVGSAAFIGDAGKIRQPTDILVVP